MGTRCVTVIQDEQGKNICAVYRQMDGYPEGHGKELAEFLRGRCIINGIPLGVNTDKCSNGMGCLAASLIGHFKTGIGSIYMCSPENHSGGAYLYTVYPDKQGIKLRVETCFKPSKVLFDDYADAFTPEACREDDEEDQDDNE